MPIGHREKTEKEIWLYGWRGGDRTLTIAVAFLGVFSCYLGVERFVHDAQYDETLERKTVRSGQLTELKIRCRGLDNLVITTPQGERVVYRGSYGPIAGELAEETGNAITVGTE